MNVYAVQQRPRNAADISLNLQRRAAAFASGIIPETTRTRIHCRRQHERGGKSQRHRRPADGHLLIFEWLAQDFQHAAIELRQFVQEQNALMRQRHFAGPR